MPLLRSCHSRSLSGFFLLCLLLVMQQASALSLMDDSGKTLGLHARYFQEDGRALDLPAARALLEMGGFTQRHQSVPSFGIGAEPVWLHLPLENTHDVAQIRQLLVGVTWINRLDVYLVRDGKVLAQWLAGDADVRWQKPEPGLGYVFTHDFAPGVTELYLRAETPDPLLLSLQIFSPPALVQAERSVAYSYGLVYGLLLALVAYNALLYFGMRQRSHRDYAIYLAFFTLLNIGYTGHGYAWLWPQSPISQNYVVLVLMVFVPCAGFRFASGFLDLPRYASGLARGLRLASLILLMMIAVLFLLQWQRAAALLAFSVFSAFAFVMVWLGVHALRQQRIAGRYFLTGASAAMLGAAITCLTVWGFLPYSSIGFRAAEIGFSLEAILLSLAVAYHLRQQERARREAEELARMDPLTGLYNRRAFLETADALWQIAHRHERGLALILLDLDRFKAVNERYGHAIGDTALQEVAKLLQQACRPGDLLARWGGEEFVLLLPEFTLVQAKALAERLCRQLSGETLRAGSVPLLLQGSFGVAEGSGLDSMQDLMHEADRQLFRAKQAGRNCVFCTGMEVPEDDAAIAS